VTDIVDTSELGLLTADLTRAALVAPVAVRPVVQRGAYNVKQGWRERWTGLVHAPYLPNAVTYDTDERPWGAEAEIGPDKDKTQGALGNLLEYGSVKNAPIPGGAPALEAELPDFEKYLGDVAEGLL
jgi:hypothetical protein